MLRYRTMRSADIPNCVDIVRSHPMLGPLYGSEIEYLAPLWKQLLGREAFRAVVFEETKAGRIRIVGVGISVFISDAFIDEVKTPPFFWIGPEITRRMVHGNPPLLSDRELRGANSNGGVNLTPWVAAFDEEHLQSPDAYTTMIAAFVAEHRGFLLKELITSGMSVETLEGAIRSGGLLADPASGRYGNTINRPLAEIVARPHLVGLTRELAKASFGTWIGSLFVHTPPQCNFRRSEQRLLLVALQGETDKELARELGVSLSAVKKAWRSIYARVAPRVPGLISDPVPEEPSSERGREKKQRLLAYLREHPEELRPASI